MNRPAIAISLLAAAALAASVGLPSSTVDARHRDNRLQYYKMRAEAYESAYGELLAGLDRVDRLNQRRTRRAAKQIGRTIERTRRRAAAFLEETAVDATVVVVDPVRDRRDTWYETAEPMSPRDFRALRSSVDDASFAAEKKRIVDAAAEHNWFTVEQVVSLVKAATFADTQIDIAVTLYPRVLDLSDWYKVYDALDFESSRTKLRKRVRALEPRQ